MSWIRPGETLLLTDNKIAVTPIGVPALSAHTISWCWSGGRLLCNAKRRDYEAYRPNDFILFLFWLALGWQFAGFQLVQENDSNAGLKSWLSKFKKTVSQFKNHFNSKANQMLPTLNASNSCKPELYIPAGYQFILFRLLTMFIKLTWLQHVLGFCICLHPAL